ncbi:hypothetical protein J4458_02705 [Candidatus Woesearchaeota archaeon]|nr:hypothetical protein [Candidatus Woesearchaeota archaeon]
MILVLDNNILFSIMNPKSVASYLFSSLKADFFTTEFALSELNKHKADCLSKSKLSEHEFGLRLLEAKALIKFFKSSEYSSFLAGAIDSLPEDPKDSPYLALALSIKAAIWSNDPHLKKQSLVKVYSTKELIDKLLNEEL